MTLAQGARAPVGLPAALALLERSIGYARASLQAVRPELLSNPTPCRDWDLRALLAHMSDSLAALREAADLDSVALRPAAAVPGTGIVDTIREQACSLLGAWMHRARSDARVRVADRAMPAGLLAAAGAVEITVHGWDVAQACGLRHPLPAELAAELLDVIALVVSPSDRPARFADPVAVPSSAGHSQRLLAELGRRAPTPSRLSWRST